MRKPGRKDTRVIGRKEEEGRREGRGGGDVSPLQKKMRQKVQARKVQTRGEKL